MATAEPSAPLEGLFRAGARGLLAEFEEIDTRHAGGRGAGREEAFREWLARMLPGKLGVATGELVDTAGRVSAQHDVIVYDALETPLLGDPDRAHVRIPVEGAYAVIEIASVLTSAKLQEDAAKIHHAKTLEKRAYYNPPGVPMAYNLHGRRNLPVFPLLGFVFAYSSKVKRGATLAKALEVTERGLEPWQRVDFVASLAGGVITNMAPDGQSMITPDATTVRHAIGQEPAETLSEFFFTLLGAVGQAKTNPISVLRYARTIPPTGDGAGL